MDMSKLYSFPGKLWLSGFQPKGQNSTFSIKTVLKLWGIVWALYGRVQARNCREKLVRKLEKKIWLHFESFY